tara:strand:+ start:280 stop:471 length:192 start_codon:yes stop_codon:yes gene_type:complete
VKIFRLLGSALEALVLYLQYRRNKYIDEIEDEIDSLARNGSASAKLRIERLGQRLKRERERTI